MTPRPVRPVVDTWRLVVIVAITGAWAGCSCPSNGPFDTDSGVVDAEVEAESDAQITLPDAGDAGLSPCEISRRTGDPLGCSYLIASPMFSNASYACTVLFVSNPSDAPAKLELRWRGQPLDVSQFARRPVGFGSAMTYVPLSKGDTLGADETALVALIQGTWSNSFPAEKCPFPAAIEADVQVQADSVGDAFELRSSTPVSAVYESAYGAGSFTASELRSTANWDRRYREIGFSTPDRPSYVDAAINPYETFPSHTMVFGNEPTKISLVREAGVEDWLVDGGPLALDRVQDDKFIGTIITGTSPIGVGVGIRLARVPWNFSHVANGLEIGDYHQFSSPASWGYVYAAVRHPPRYGLDNETAVWKIIADVDGTTLTYEPVAPAGAPTQLAAGQMIAFEASGPFVVRSQNAQHPFYVSQLMTTGVYGVCATCEHGAIGNAELIATPPPEEFAYRFAYFTDHALPETHVVIIRRNDGNGFADVTSDCAGTITGWKPVGTAGEFEYSYLALSRGAGQKFVPQVYPSGTCDNGAHWMKSTGRIALSVWGWSNPNAYPPPPNEDESTKSYGYVPFGVGPRPDRPPPN